MRYPRIPARCLLNRPASQLNTRKTIVGCEVDHLLKRELIQIKSDGIELTIKGKATGIEE